MENIKLTEYSHGAGCGCKISPSILTQILHSNEAAPNDEHLLVGNSSRDDAAVYDIGNGQALISTTDFFMPIVDDPFTFGRIAATNAISDVYAMGGKPVLAIAILGWPIDKLSPEVANAVVAGGRKACADAGIVLAGGHSIDCPEPIFGLAVNGMVPIENLKRNDTAQEGDILFLTKKLGVGVLSTASKKKLITPGDLQIAIDSMTTLNKIGQHLGACKFVNALTDVTGFGLLGHLCEMAQGASLSAEIYFDKIPVLDKVDYYLQQNCIPGGTKRNWASYGHNIGGATPEQINILCDPQTSGGLLVAVSPRGVSGFLEISKKYLSDDYILEPVGRIIKQSEMAIIIN